MTAADRSTDTAMGGSYGTVDQLANSVRWAFLLVDAALPLDVLPATPAPGVVPADIAAVEEDRAGFRLEAFSQVLAQLIEGGWMATPGQLRNMTVRKMPGQEA